MAFCCNTRISIAYIPLLLSVMLRQFNQRFPRVLAQGVVSLYQLNSPDANAFNQSFSVLGVIS
jgi:uncharacterized membrane protein